MSRLSDLVLRAARLARGPLWTAQERALGAAREARTARRVRLHLDLVRRCDYTADDLAAHRAALAAAERLETPLRVVHWYVPYFEYAYYGGIHTILRFASGWRARQGVKSRLVVYDAPRADPAALRARVAEAFPDLAAIEVLVLRDGDRVPPSDAAIATHWPSAYLVLKDRGAARKLYFIQDFEPLFYPAGTEYALAEATYRLGLPAIVNTPGLAAIYERDYGGRAFSFVPAVDARVFHPPAAPCPERPFRVFFYGRPRNERNAFELGLAALAELERRRGAEVEVVVAGDAPPLGVARRFPGVRFMGRLPYERTGDLYRTCHAGVALMLTRHPSYLPFELMACGAVPVATVNPACSWLLRDGENALVVEPGASALASALERLVDDAALRERLAAEGVRAVGEWGWEAQVDGAAAFARGDSARVRESTR
jgi:glycosyltransferase involved in cell wall biosynthesis